MEKKSASGTMVFTILALVFTGITAWLLSTMLSGTKYSQEPLESVVVARNRIDALRDIQKEDLRMIEVPASAIPQGAYRNMEELLTDPPQRPLVVLHRGEMILKGRLSDPTAGWGVASKIPPGMRALAIRVDNALTIARLLFPGATVDVLATLRMQSRDLVATQIILQGVQVLAVNANVDATVMSGQDSADGQHQTEVRDIVVALLVTQEEAELLTLAGREGRLDLVVRNLNDDQIRETQGVQPEDLFPSITENAAAKNETERKANIRSDGPARRVLEMRRRRTKPSQPAQKSEAPTIQIH